METEEECWELPCCSTVEQCPISPGSPTDIVTRSLFAVTPRDTVWPWRRYKVLLVKFMNVSFMREKKWTVGNGESLNTINILNWANVWSKRGGEIPEFVEAKPGDIAQIRVEFNAHGICNSKVGTKAQTVEAETPTMNLDLQTNCNTSYKRHLVIHEFGHALGLGHEHQRSTFWRDIRPYIDQEKMKGYLRGCMGNLSGEAFEHFWRNNYAEDKLSELGQATEYDPESIMHYWFRRDWLRPPYNDKAHVKKCEREGKLPANVIKALLGVHKRHHKLADEPSELDIQLMRKVYGGGRGDDIVEMDGVEMDRVGGARVRQDFSERDSSLTQSSLSSFGSCRERGSLGGLSSPSDSGLSLPSLAAVRDPIDMTGCYNGEVEHHHLNRIDYIDRNGTEKGLEIYDQAAHKWERIGSNLGLEKGTLTSIRRNGYDDRDRVMMVLGDHWLTNAANLRNSNKYPKTWSALVTLLDKSHLADLSSKLQDALVAENSSLRDN